nr:SprT family zinc-dependent metalloprotease [Clostridium sp. DSM 8431]
MIIKDNCDVIIRAPFGTSEEYISNVVNKKRVWIESKLEKFKNRHKLNDDEVMFLGEVYKKVVIEQEFLKREFVCIDKDRLLINVKNKENELKVLEKFFREQCKTYIKEIVKEYISITGLVPKEIKIKEQKTKWGCCTYDNRIFINWKLIMARKSAIKYVIVHEMCHILEKNHSKNFWNKVNEFFPNYKIEDIYLKENGYLMKLKN